MRAILTAALLAVLALPAWADIVDSGSLIIGSQGVIGGTFTVQGTALGVAGAVSATSATLSGMGAQIYSLTTSSGIHILAGGVRWPDGTMSTSAAAAGGVGNAQLSATQTWSGANTFASTTTVGNSSVYTTTLSYASVVRGGWSVVALSSFTSVSGVTLTNFISSYTFRIAYNVRQNTNDAYFQMLINEDTTSSRYFSEGIGYNGGQGNSGSYVCSSALNAANYFCLNNNGGGDKPKAGKAALGELFIATDPGDRKNVWIRAQQVFYNGTTTTGTSGGGTYQGVSEISTVHLMPNTGTWTGYITVEALAQQVAY